MRRRDLLRSAAWASVSTVAAPMINRGRFQLFADTRTEYSTRAIDLLGRSTVIDMLGLLTMDWQKLSSWQRDPKTFTAADLQKLRSSRIDVFHPAVELNEADPYAATHGWLDDWNAFLARQSDSFVRVDCAADIPRARRQGKIAIVLGMQNSCHFRSAADVSHFHALGQRVSQLTYNSRNAIGCGCAERPDDGLTDFGESIVTAMNKAGMVIDVSHSGEQTTMDAFEISKKPVLITHANCGALVRNPRCKSDRVIREMAKTGSVMGITGIRSFVSQQELVSVASVMAHYDHVIRLVGVEHVGVGSDAALDGRDVVGNSRRQRYDIAGLNHPRRMFDLTEGLIGRRYANRSIELILGGNFQRVLGETLAAVKTDSPA